MLIKQGVQSLAIRLPGHRVLKVANSTRTARRLWRKWHANVGLHDEQRIKRDAAKSLLDRKFTIAYVKTLSKKYPEFIGYFGNPRFFGHGIYVQEYAQVLSTVVHSQDRRANVALFERYAQSILEEWRYGFSDVTFNFTANSGLDTKGRIVLFDFGDITLDLTEAQDVVRKKSWLRSWSYMHDLPDAYKKDFARVMQKTITLANLKRNWGVALISASAAITTML